MFDGWVYVGGTFDLFHAGHARFLERCKSFGKVVVALNTDEFAARYKRRPFLSLAERHDILESCKYVDKVVVNVGNENTGLTISLMPLDIKINYIAHGDDWTGDSLMQQLGIDQDWLDFSGIRMLYIPYTKGISSSDIIGRINGEHHRRGNCSCELGWACSYIGVAGKPDPEA